MSEEAAKNSLLKQAQSDEQAGFVQHAFDVLEKESSFSGKGVGLDYSMYDFCACRKKVIPLTEYKKVHTSVTKQFALLSGKDAVPVTDKICDTCEKDTANFCKIVCVTCMEVISRFAPWKCSKTGFEYKAGQFYHVRACPKCDPSLSSKSVSVAEFEYYFKHILGKKK